MLGDDTLGVTGPFSLSNSLRSPSTAGRAIPPSLRSSRPQPVDRVGGPIALAIAAAQLWSVAATVPGSVVEAALVGIRERTRV